jgi:molecular chaperone DnaK
LFDQMHKARNESQNQEQKPEGEGEKKE